MTCSFQTYRIKIGTYAAGQYIYKKKFTKKTTEKDALKGKFTLSLIFASYCLLVLLVPALLHLQNRNTSQGTGWRPCPCTSTYISTLSHASSKAGLARGSPPWLTARVRNFLARMTFGNRKEHGIKIIHWNKGPSYMENKHNDIEDVIASHKPHVLGLSEANIRKGHDLANVQIRDYQLHTALSLHNENIGVSRVAVYTHKSLVVKRRNDLENDTIASIWLEIGLPRTKKILICNAYREWKHLYQDNNRTGTIQAQLERWGQLLDQWERALSEGKEGILAIDANIDFLKWTDDNLASNCSTSRLKPLIEELFSRIFPHGVCQVVKVATRA